MELVNFQYHTGCKFSQKLLETSGAQNGFISHHPTAFTLLLVRDSLEHRIVVALTQWT